MVRDAQDALLTMWGFLYCEAFRKI